MNNSRQTGRSRTPVRGGARVSLARALSKLGAASRSQARLLIEQGRVSVNQRTEKNPDTWVDLKSDRILVDERRIVASAVRWLMLHKPMGVVTTRSDERGRKTVFDLLGDEERGLKVIGRLDLDTAGLLLLTTDSRRADALTDPRNAIPKRYVVTTDPPLKESDVAQLRSGVEIRLPAGPYKTKPATVEIIGECAYSIILNEGKNRQVRRMIEAVGSVVVHLERVEFGSVVLGDLPVGSWRDLAKEEVERLHGLVAGRRRPER